MESLAPRQDDFSFRLAQWLLEQLKSEEELKTVTQQFSALASQVQATSIKGLHKHIGRLMFQKCIQPTEHRFAQLYALLCRSLFLASLKQRSTASPPPTPVHEYLFSFCLDYTCPNHDSNSTETKEAAAWYGLSQYEVSGPRPLSSDKAGDRNLEVSSLVLELYKYGLVSTAQIYEYIFQLTTRPEPDKLNDLRVVHTLLDGCLSQLDMGLWEGELEYLRTWVNTSRSDADYQEMAQKVNDLLDRALNKRPPSATNSQNMVLDLRHLSVSTPAQSIASERVESPIPLSEISSPCSNDTVTDFGDAAASVQSEVSEDDHGSLRNNRGSYMHGIRSMDPYNNLKRISRVIAAPALNSGVHRLQSERYSNSVHPFAVVDPSQPEFLPERPSQTYPQHKFSSSESSFSSAGSSRVLPLPLSGLTSHGPLPTNNALAINKREKRDRPAKVIESQAGKEKKGRTKPEKPKRTMEESVIDWLVRDNSAARGSLDHGKRK